MEEAKESVAKEIVEAAGQDDSVLDDAATAKLIQEIKQGYREWEFEDVKYRSRFPVSQEDNDANWAYSKAFNRGLKEDLPTSSEMDKMLRSRGLWSDDDEKELQDWREEIERIEASVAKKELDDRSKPTVKLIERLMELRGSLMVKSGTYREYMNQTVEAKADEARLSLLVANCTETSDGKKVWDSPGDFMNDKRKGLVNTATYEYITFVSGMSENYLEDLTEVKFLRAGKDAE